METSPTYLQGMKKGTVVQSVIDHLTDAIRYGVLKPGDRIPPEPELAASLGVARSSVREATKILTYLGVLEGKRAEGTFVCDGFRESMIDPMIYGIILNQDSFDNLMELRGMTEVGMIDLAMEHRTEEEIEELGVLLQELTDAAYSEVNPVSKFFEADNRFHDKIAEMGKNPMADKINRVVRTLTEAVRYHTADTMINCGRIEELLETHRDLIEAIRRRDRKDLSEKVRNSYFEDAITANIESGNNE